ncbi:MAG: S8 family serine peptidase [Candidatus Sericytochromatia bacterium]|nr:S8 family serine peptidase [Candidatus Sericytochromatia bacterium]
MALDEPPNFAPDAAGAETLGGKLHYNLAVVPKVGKIFIHRRLPGAPEGSGIVEVVDSADRLADIRRLVGDDPNALVEPDIPLETLLTPNDPDLARQWGLTRIQAPLAWDKVQGGPLVAVIDTGIDGRHPDLAGQVVQGRDFVNNDDDATDDQGHGTHVAGTVAAVGDNKQGAAGVAYRSKVLAVKVLSARGSGSSIAVADGIRYAVKAGARVINMSLGSPFPSRFIGQAVAEAIAAGVVVVAAAGNQNTKARAYPAAFPGVIAVGASTPSDSRASFSNHGDWVGIAAPGLGIHQTHLRNGYASLSGTSMAAPHVAGAAALVLAAHPAWKADAVRDALLRTGDPVRGFELNPALRRLNVAQALAYVPSAATPVPSAAPTTRASAAPLPDPATKAIPVPSPTAITPPSSPGPSASTVVPPASPSPVPSTSQPLASPSSVPSTFTAPASPLPSPSTFTPPVAPSLAPSTFTPPASPSPLAPSPVADACGATVSVKATETALLLAWSTRIPVAGGGVRYRPAGTTSWVPAPAATYSLVPGTLLGYQHTATISSLRPRTSYELSLYYKYDWGGQMGYCESQIFKATTR